MLQYCKIPWLVLVVAAEGLVWKSSVQNAPGGIHGDVMQEVWCLPMLNVHDDMEGISRCFLHSLRPDGLFGSVRIRGPIHQGW